MNFPEIIEELNDIIEREQFTARSMANNTIKMNCFSPDIYRKLVKFMNEKNIIHHTYQPKDEKAYRVVIKYIILWTSQKSKRN